MICTETIPLHQTGQSSRSECLWQLKSSSSGSSAGLTYGHVGIYIGDGKVIDNIGRIRVTTLDDWIATFCKHHPVGFGFPPNVKK
ncbi:hypothetical protein HMPREF9333_02284 [Johnsonella ignava ATCC 51276]|uniref:NlpC/P60 domain-containing protein n=1 Tax=Johnsonella ignava ATCC 51276 TaxID=679200 RepID=G5GL39_9FIRM|nr:hypothetical protein HMPREF9333_02284 [Johnsonella ignava ATCC 51276]